MIGAKQSLDVRVIDGRLVISVGVETLAFAFEKSEYVNKYDETRGAYEPTLRVINPAVFAEAVVRILAEEEEDGSTPVHFLLDKSCAAAVENGCEGIEP